jgi:hypothetical protein
MKQKQLGIILVILSALLLTGAFIYKNKVNQQQTIKEKQETIEEPKLQRENEYQSTNNDVDKEYQFVAAIQDGDMSMFKPENDGEFAKIILNVGSGNRDLFIDMILNSNCQNYPQSLRAMVKSNQLNFMQIDKLKTKCGKYLK